MERVRALKKPAGPAGRSLGLRLSLGSGHQVLPPPSRLPHDPGSRTIGSPQHLPRVHIQQPSRCCARAGGCPPRALPRGPSPWLQKRLHSFAKISPIMSPWAGGRVPEQQVPPRRRLRGKRGEAARGRELWEPAGRGAPTHRSASPQTARRRVPAAVLCSEPAEPNADP